MSATARPQRLDDSLPRAAAFVAERLEAWAEGELLAHRSAEQNQRRQSATHHWNASRNYGAAAALLRDALKKAGTA